MHTFIFHFGPYEVPLLREKESRHGPQMAYEYSRPLFSNADTPHSDLLTRYYETREASYGVPKAALPVFKAPTLEAKAAPPPKLIEAALAAALSGEPEKSSTRAFVSALPAFVALLCVLTAPPLVIVSVVPVPVE